MGTSGERTCMNYLSHDQNEQSVQIVGIYIVYIHTYIHTCLQVCHELVNIWMSAPQMCQSPIHLPDTSSYIGEKDFPKQKCAKRTKWVSHCVYICTFLSRAAVNPFDTRESPAGALPSPTCHHGSGLRGADSNPSDGPEVVSPSLHHTQQLRKQWTWTCLFPPSLHPSLFSAMEKDQEEGGND